MKKISMAILGVCFLSGCAVETPGQLRSVGITQQFTVNETYEVIHRKILRQAEECLPSLSVFLASMEIVDSTYPENKSSTIKIVLRNMGVRNHYAMIEIDQANDTSNVAVYSQNLGVWKDYPRKVEKWARGGTGCD